MEASNGTGCGHGDRGTGRDPRRRFSERSRLSDSRRSRRGQDHARAAVPARRRRSAARTALYITLSETRRELHAVARSHGWSLDGVEIHEHLVREETLSEDEDTTIFHPSEVELGQTVARILERGRARQAAARRVRFALRDPPAVAERAALSQQILALKQYFTNRGCTVLLLDDRTADGQRPAAAQRRRTA